MAGGPVTVLFTDLVSSTELLQRVGDEQALRVLRAHQRLLRDTLVVHGGHEVKWTGDGLMTCITLYAIRQTVTGEVAIFLAQASSTSSAFASTRSRVSKPSVNQP
jgi:class 3 adenylate cyclase